jgi:putative ABC transport system permease protein
MKIVKGRAFSRDFPSDSSGVIINEAEAKLLGYEDPIGRKIGTATGREVDVNKPALDVFTIIGVVKDFNHNSLHEPVGGLAMYLKRNTYSTTCKFMPGTNVPELISFIKSKWSENAPDQPFEYDFVNESLDRQYSGEIRLGRILGIFTGLAFFISCLGLIGLALFAAEQRKKEIGLRKVNGSGITQIIWLLTSDFTKLIMIAFIIATPVSWYMMNKWLESFAYRINISIWVFIATGLISYLIAMCAVGYFSYRAAATNPVETLKNE